MTNAELQAFARQLSGTSGQFNEDLSAALTVCGAPEGRQIVERLNAVFRAPGANAQQLALTYGLPSLFLDFTRGETLDPRITFSRTSSATRFNSNGVLVTEASNQPRINFDPVTLACKGLLIEGQRTNSVRNNTMQGAAVGTPGTLPTNWAGLTVAGVAGDVVGVGTENGISYLDVRVSGTPSASTYYNLAPELLTSGVSGQTWAGSFWAKLVAGSLNNTNANLEIRESDVSQTFLVNTLTNIPLSGTLVRYSQARGLTNASTAYVSVRAVFQLTSGAAVDFTVRLGMPQLEQGAFATSVIPTTSVATTRAVDYAIITGTNFSSWYNQTEGTFYTEGDISSVGGAGYPGFFAVDDGTAGTTMQLFVSDVVADYPYFEGKVAGASQFAIVGAAAYTGGSLQKIAGAYKLNDFSGAFGGTLGTPATAGAVPTVNTARIGSVSNSSHPLNGHIRKISYYPRRLSDAQLQAITN